MDDPAQRHRSPKMGSSDLRGHLRGKAAPGVDGVKWADYEADIEPRLGDLHAASSAIDGCR